MTAAPTSKSPTEPGLGPWDLTAERDLIADAGRRSFFLFCDVILGYSRPEYRWWTPRVHRPFCDWFQSHALEWLETGKGKKLMVIVLREFGKTMVITKAGQLWLHLQNSNLSTYTGSVSVLKAAGWASFFDQLLRGGDNEALFNWCYGDWYDPKRTWKVFEMTHGARQNTTRTEPSFGTWGVSTGLTGTHPDAGFMDDPIDYDTMRDDAEWLRKVKEHIDGLAPVFRASSFFVYTGTRYHDADFQGESIRTEGVRSVTGMPMPGSHVVSPENTWDVYYFVGRDEAGTPTFPENWPESRLRAYQRLNSIHYAAQIMNNPLSGDHVALTPEDIEPLYIRAEELPSDLRISLHFDVAFKSNKSMGRGDHTVIVVAGHPRDGSGTVYYLQCNGSRRWDVTTFAKELVILLQRLRAQRRYPFALTDEMEVGGRAGTWAPQIQNWCHDAGLPTPPMYMLSRGGKSKVSRLLRAAGFWKDGKVRVVRGGPGNDMLVDQMLRIGVSAFDDYADAAADAFSEDVYRVARYQPGAVADNSIRRPWDDVILTKQSSEYGAETIRQLYDADVDGTREW